MSSTATRMPLAEAQAIAARFSDLIWASTDRIQVAGSIRRRASTVGDVEIVAVPKIETVRYTSPGLFDDVVTDREVDRLAERMESLLADGVIQKRPRSDGQMFWGPTAKYLTFERVNVDLFSPCAERFGWILAIRTGPAAFSNALVTPKGKRTHNGRQGLMPPYLRAQDGWLTYRTSGERIDTPEEVDVFSMLKLRFIEPGSRV